MLKQATTSYTAPLMMEAPPWKTLEVEGQFVIDVPGDSKTVVDDGEFLLTVNLSTDPPSAVHVSQYAFDPADVKAAGTNACLQAAVEVYANNHLPRTSSRTSADFEYRTGLRDHLWVCEAVLASDRRSWRVHAVAAIGSPTYYVLSWTGARKFLYGPVLEIFESFATL